MSGLKTGKDTLLVTSVRDDAVVRGSDLRVFSNSLRNGLLDYSSDVKWLYDTTEKLANKGVASGYAGLNANSLVAGSHLGAGTPSVDWILANDGAGAGVWKNPATSLDADKVDGYHASDIIALIPDPATTVVSEAAWGYVAPVVGSGTKYARDDHTHGRPLPNVYGDLQGYLPVPYIKYDTVWISQLTATTKYYLRSSVQHSWYLQSFTAADLLNELITSISLKLQHVGTIATGKKVWLEVYAYEPSGELPAPTGSVLGTSAAIYVDEIATAEAVYKFAFKRAIELQLTTVNTQAYCYILKGDYDVSADNHIGVGAVEASNYAGGQMWRYDPGLWYVMESLGGGADMYFSINVGYNGVNIKLDAIDAGAGYLPIANLPLSIPDRKLAQITTASKVALGAIVPVTASKALQSSASGIIEASTVTATELGYVSGITSAIQTQMNLKAPLISPALTTPNIGVASGTSLTLTNPLTVPNGGTGAATLTDGGLLVGAGTGAIEALAVGAANQILVGVASANPAWLTIANNALVYGGAAGVPTSSATLTYNGTSALSVGSGVSTPDCLIEVGAGRTANGYAYLDLIGDTTYTDFALRIMRYSTGANAISAIQHRGTGELQIVTTDAGALTLHTTNTERMRISAAGVVTIANTLSVYAPATSPTIDCNSNAATLADDATIAIGGSNAFSGLVLVTSHSNGSTGLFVVGAGGVALIASSWAAYAATDTDGSNCLYWSGTTYLFKNRMGSTQTYAFCLIRTRNTA